VGPASEPGDPVADAVAAATGVAVTDSAPVGGGCVSDARRVVLADGRTVFAKGAAGLPAGLLDVEAAALRWLGEVPGVAVPGVAAVTDDVLVLEWVPPGPPTRRTDESLGRRLAALHRAEPGSDRFGWDRDGFIGRLPQRNTPGESTWAGFWLSHRIRPLVDRAVGADAIDQRARRVVERLADRLPRLAGPAELPVRVHGDLWSGNVHVDAQGEPWLIDPAPYRGHREVDLAMLHLFGRPGPATVAAYDEVFPLADGWRDRLRLWQAEPLLVHAVMFGGGYGASALSVLDRFA
jgi:fructosamine-3-kinase